MDIGHYIAQYIPDFVWGLAAFVVFVAILLRLALKPVLTAIDARDARIKSQLDEAEGTYTKAKELQAKLDHELAHAEEKIRGLMAEARAEAEQSKAKVLAAGRDEVEALRTKALREIDQARYQAIVDLHREVADIATQVAERILAQNLDDSRQTQLVKAAIGDYEQRMRKP